MFSSNNVPDRMLGVCLTSNCIIDALVRYAEPMDDLIFDLTYMEQDLGSGPTSPLERDSSTDNRDDE